MKQRNEPLRGKARCPVCWDKIADCKKRGGHYGSPVVMTSEVKSAVEHFLESCKGVVCLNEVNIKARIMRSFPDMYMSGKCFVNDWRTGGKLQCFSLGCKRDLELLDADGGVLSSGKQWYGEYLKCPIHGEFVLGTPLPKNDEEEIENAKK